MSFRCEVTKETGRKPHKLGDLHTVILAPNAGIAESTARAWRRSGYSARAYPRAVKAGGAWANVVAVVVRSKRAGGTP